MAVTLRDVGRRAGVSAMTVSRVINGRAAAPARSTGLRQKDDGGGVNDREVDGFEHQAKKNLSAPPHPIPPFYPRAGADRSICSKNGGGG